MNNKLDDLIETKKRKVCNMKTKELLEIITNIKNGAVRNLLSDS